MAGKQVARHVRPPHRRNGPGRAALAVVTVVAAAVAVAVALNLIAGWSVASLWGHDRDSRAGSATPASPTRDDEPSPSAGTSRDDPSVVPAAKVRSLRACARRVANAGRVVAAAGEGIGHWRQHVQARTDMLEGRISEKKMNRVWNRTQHAGPGDVRRFRAAADQFPSRSHCGAPGTYPPRLRGVAKHCAVRSEAAARALEAAHSAMRDWRVHLANMTKFSRGRMSAAMAQGKWVQAWRNAPINITAYRTARAVLERAPECTVG